MAEEENNKEKEDNKNNNENKIPYPSKLETNTGNC